MTPTFPFSFHFAPVTVFFSHTFENWVNEINGLISSFLICFFTFVNCCLFFESVCFIWLRMSDGVSSNLNVGNLGIRNVKKMSLIPKTGSEKKCRRAKLHQTKIHWKSHWIARNELRAVKHFEIAHSKRKSFSIYW